MVIRKNNVGDRPNDFVTESGSPFMDTFTGELQKDGTVKLIKTGKRNIYQEIQSYKDSVDINKIVERFQNGEVGVLNQIQGVYMDLTEAPKSIFDAMEKLQKARYVFDRLDPEIRSKFNNNFEEWCLSAGEENWISRMNTDEDKVVDKKEGVTE